MFNCITFYIFRKILHHKLANRRVIYDINIYDNMRIKNKYKIETQLFLMEISVNTKSNM